MNLVKKFNKLKLLKLKKTKEKTDRDKHIDKIVAHILNTIVGDQTKQHKFKDKKDWLSLLLVDGLVDKEKLDKFLIKSFTNPVYDGTWDINEFRDAIKKTENIFENINSISAELKIALNESDTIKDNELKNKDGSWNMKNIASYVEDTYNEAYKNGTFTLDELKYAIDITTGEYKKKWEKKK